MADHGGPWLPWLGPGTPVPQRSGLCGGRRGAPRQRDGHARLWLPHHSEAQWTGDEPGKTCVLFFFTFLRYMIWERYEIIPWHIGWLTVVCATVIPFKWRLKIPSPQLIVWLWENRPSFVDWELVFQAGSILLEGIQPGFSEFLRSYYHIPGYSQSFGTMIGFGRHTWGTLLLWNWSAGPSHVATTFMRHLIIAKFESHKVLMLCFGAFEMCSMGQWT